MRSMIRSLGALTIVVTLSLPSSLFAENQPPAWRALFQPLPERAESPLNPITEDKIALGRRLYSDPILSLAQDISCNSCHDLKRFGVDNQPTSPGHQGVRGDRNSPTSFNAALHVAQFWDGRAKDVEEQALGPVLNPKEMAMTGEAPVLERLRASSEYPKLFATAFPGEADPITFKNIGRAIGAFERTLLTPSRFDDYLRGDEGALTATEIKGVQTFVEVGCTACHNGAAIGGGMYQKIGLIKPYPTTDMGRYTVTKDENDRFVFKVPSLRNIEKTAPYFHDGSVATLDEAVRLMGSHQLGRVLTADQVQSIVSFLGALTGRLPATAHH